MEKWDCLLHSQEQTGSNLSSLGTPEVTAGTLRITPKTRGDTYNLPKILHILVPRRCEQYSGLCTSVGAIFSEEKGSLIKPERYNSQSNTGHKYDEHGKGGAVTALRGGKPSTKLPKNEAS